MSIKKNQETYHYGSRRGTIEGEGYTKAFAVLLCVQG